MKKFKLKTWQWVTLIAYLLILNVIIITLAMLLWNDPSLLSFSSEPAQVADVAGTPKATLRPTFTPTFTPEVWPTSTSTPTSGPTQEPTATWTPLPTRTPHQTEALTSTPTTELEPIANATAVDTLAQVDEPIEPLEDASVLSDVDDQLTTDEVEDQPVFSAARATEVAPTNTPQPTSTKTATATPRPTRTKTPTATSTSNPTATASATPSPTNTATRTPTKTPTPKPTKTPSPTVIASATPTSTATSTVTPKPTKTQTPKPTATATSTPAKTATLTPKPSATLTSTPVPTATPTASATSTVTATATPKPTQTQSPTETATSTPKAVSLGVMEVQANPLTDGRVGLNWEADGKDHTYRVYSDMGTGYGVYVYKGETSEAAFLDNISRPGMIYAYRVESLGDEAVLSLAMASVVSYQRPDIAGTGVLASASSDSTKRESNVTIIPAPTALPPDALLLGIMSDASYTDKFNILSVVGEVRNDSNLDVGDISVVVSFYDATGSFISEATGKTMLDNLAPGERAPFLLNLTRPAGMSNYSVKAVGRPVPPQLKPQISIVDSKAYEDDIGFYHVTGNLKNTGSVVVPRAKVIVTLYGRDGGVINVNFAYPIPAQLQPGDLASFDVSFTYFPKVLNHTIAVVND